MSPSFPPIHFQGQLRPSQADVVKIARRKLAAGKRRLHIVAPPGSGKTVLGLYLWAECIRQPAPYQDLAYFVRPTPEELSFVANADDQLHEIVADLCRPKEEPESDDEQAAEGEEDTEAPPATRAAGPAAASSTSAEPLASSSAQHAAPLFPSFAATGERLPDWLMEVLAQRRLPTGIQKDWDTFQRRDPVFAQAARIFLLRRGHPLPPDTPPPDTDGDWDEMPVTFADEQGFRVINGRGADWCPRVYVALITDLFQRGLSQCLVGTRGLLGEGWDANKVNVLIDLTTVTTSMTVNQLRGRSIRLDPDEPTKLANNWDVVCIAPEFSKGLDDYRRFIAKHRTIFGVTDDGAIEKGVGHVHAAFAELKPEGLEDSTNILNADMLVRAGRRDEARSNWRIGQPYSPEPIRALETNSLGGGGGFPPFGRSRQPWGDRSLALAIGEAILMSLREARLLRKRRKIHAGSRDGGYVRVFLEGASEEESTLFTQALQEALGPLDRPRYVIPRYTDHFQETWLSSILPSIVGKYFRKRRRRRTMLHAVPSVLAKNKDLALIYQRHWNRCVSPGEALYAYRGAGKELIAVALREGQTPKGRIHKKEIFL